MIIDQIQIPFLYAADKFVSIIIRPFYKLNTLLLDLIVIVFTFLLNKKILRFNNFLICVLVELSLLVLLLPRFETVQHEQKSEIGTPKRKEQRTVI